MTASAALLNQLTVDDYAREAFCMDASSTSGFVQGGVYAGPLHVGRDGSPEQRKYNAPGDKLVSARARLVTVVPGKVFVRWVNSHMLSTATWKAAAEGIWWMTDNIADRVVDETIKRFGPHGSTGTVARHFGNVGYTWRETDTESYKGAPGTYRNDLGAVVVCRTTKLIKVLIGVGRPVVNPTGPQMQNVSVDSGELQIVMLTTISSPNGSDRANDQSTRRRFIGDEFLTCLFFGPDFSLPAWWLRNNIVDRRRSAKVGAVRRR